MKTRGIFIFIFSVCLYLSFSVTPSYASQDREIKVSGYSLERSGSAFLDENGMPLNHPAGPNVSSTFVGNYVNYLYNIADEKLVACSLGYKPPVSYVESNSLVGTDGEILVDIFFATSTNISLTKEEIGELSNFLNNGGIVYLHTTAAGGNQYVPLFEDLGLNIVFGERYDTSPSRYSSPLLAESPIVSGPFTPVGPIKHGSFREIITPDGPEPIAFSSDSGKPFLVELRVGKGYLVVSGSPLHVNLLAGTNTYNYFANLFSLPCRDDWKDNSVVLDVPSFKQGLYGDHPGDPAWEDEAYDNAFKKELKDCDLDTPGVADGTIGECGCALTSTAMVMRYHNIEKGFMGEEINPSTLNGMLNLIIGKAKTPLGYHGGLLRWLGITNLSALSHNRYPIQPKLDYKVDKFSYQRAVELIDSNLPIILKVNGGAHWVVVKGYDPSLERLIINDPAYPDPPGGKYTYLDERYAPASGSSMRLFVPTYSDFRYFQIASEENKVTITDSHGNAIPDLDYLFEENYINPTLSQNLPTGGIHTWTFMLPPDGEFQVEASAPFTVYTSDKEGNLSSKEFDLSGQSTKYRFLYDNETAGESVAQLIDIEVRPFSSNKEINIKSNAAIPVAILSSESFDVSTSKASFIGFGQTGNEQSLHRCQEKLVDVNDDGLMDRLCWFKVGEMNLNNSSKEAKLMLQDNENLYISIHTL